jgi:hypothetical protein
MASQDQVLGPFLNNGWINVGVFMSRALVTRLKTAKTVGIGVQYKADASMFSACGRLGIYLCGRQSTVCEPYG